MPEGVVTEETPRTGPPHETRLRSALRVALIAFLLSRAAFYLPAAAARYAAPDGAGPPPGHLLYHGGAPSESFWIDLPLKWDAFWSLNVAREGYHWHGTMQQVAGTVTGPESNTAAFPLLPVVVWACSLGFMDLTLVGLTVCNIVFLLSLMAMFRYAQSRGGDDYARRCVFYVAFFPTAFVYSSIYSEPFFILFSVLTLHALEQRRYALAGVCGVLLTAARLPGAVIVPAMAAWVLHRRRADGVWPRGAVLATMAAPLGIATFFLYLWITTGRPNVYFLTQQGWDKCVAWPSTGVVLTLRSVFDDPTQYGKIIDLIFLVVVAVFTLRHIARQPLHLAVFWGAGLLLCLSQNSLLGFPRYAGVLIPMCLALATSGQRKPVHYALLAFFTLSGALLAIAWTNWIISF